MDDCGTFPKVINLCDGTLMAGIRQERDPVERLRKLILEHSLLDSAEIKAIEKAQRKTVDEAVAAGKASPEPPVEQLMMNMNQVMDNVVVRGVDSQTRTNLAETYGR